MSKTSKAAIESLRDLSARIAGDPLLTQASTGNTSVKLGGVLWIKASGKWLAGGREDDFLIPVDLTEVRKCMQRDTDPAEHCRRASIETAMHAVLPHRVVVHVHSVNTIAWAIRADAPERLCDYDQPYEESKRIRVTGPFTVESLSPHRVLAPEADRPATEAAGDRDDVGGSFINVVLDNLLKAGVQNTVKQERLAFDRLESYSGRYLHAAGEYTPEGGRAQRVAICIGPQYGTVGSDLVNEAAKEAVQGLGFNLLIVLGFAFDLDTSEELKHYGRLQVLIAKMNPDLLMGDELLKKTGAGNLFMVFGEPDVDIRPAGKDKSGTDLIEVEIRGLDVYDPTTQEIRSRSTDDIACWFIDTDYNGESFFVRHAYFTGTDDPYEKLKRALRAEIDESAWPAPYSTVSRRSRNRKAKEKLPARSRSKVINHYGDEVLKVYSL